MKTRVPTTGDPKAQVVAKKAVAKSQTATKNNLPKAQTANKEVPPITEKMHPGTAVMVTTAIKQLNFKKGSALPSIKKYLADNYRVDVAKHAVYIRNFLKSAVDRGQLIRVDGSGAAGHFKLPPVTKRTTKKVLAEKKNTAPKKAAPNTNKKKTKQSAESISEPLVKKTKKIATKPKSLTSR